MDYFDQRMFDDFFSNAITLYEYCKYDRSKATIN